MRRELSPVLVANTDLHITFHPTLAETPNVSIPLIMEVSLVGYPTAFGGTPLQVGFSVMPTACAPTITIDAASASANVPSWPNLQMYMMIEFGQNNGGEAITTALSYYEQMPNCMYTWDVDVKYRPDLLNPANDVASTDANYPLEIQYNKLTDTVSVDKCSTPDETHGTVDPECDSPGDK
jgi:hypothetical protein